SGLPSGLPSTLPSMSLFAVPGMPLVQPGDDIAALLVEQLTAHGATLRADDIVVIAQKVVSKAEGRLVRLQDVTPTSAAHEIAATTGKDPRVTQVVLDDSNTIIRARRGLLVVEQKAGWICANAGVDRSNVAPDDDGEWLTLLPVDSDASAARIRARIAELTGVAPAAAPTAAPAVLITDSHGRAWRVGTVGVCIGCAGMPPLWDQRGQHDLFGYELAVSEECIADELAAAAALLMGQGGEGRPVVVVRGFTPPAHLPHAPAQTIQRPAHMDAFR
ncbi:MAG: coenzyme F420-0:L-glutamate ligase, partial [Litorilinea sp.]